MNDGSFHAVIRNDLAELEPLAEKVEAFVDAHALPPKLAHEINIALDEIISNTVRYGYADNGPHQIEIRIGRAGDRITTEIEDDGRAFDPLQLQDPDISKPIDEREVGGLGIFLVKKLMDETAYARRGDKNVLTLVKKLK